MGLLFEIGVNTFEPSEMEGEIVISYLLRERSLGWR